MHGVAGVPMGGSVTHPELCVGAAGARRPVAVSQTVPCPWPRCRPSLPPSPRPGGLALPAEMPFGGGVSLAAVSQAPGGEPNSFERSLMDAGHEVCERTWKWGRRSISQLVGVDE